MPTTTEALRLEQQLRSQLATIVDAQTRDLVRAWAIAWDEIAPELRDSLAELITDADGKLSRSAVLRSRRLQKALAVVADTLDQLATSAGVRISSDLRRVVDQAGAAQARIIASMLPEDQDLVGLDSWSRVDRRQVNAIVQRATEQITARHKPLSADAYQGVRRELIRGVAAGSNPRATAARMVRRAQSGFNGGLSRALTISRTETLDAHRGGAGAGQKQHKDVLAGWIWLASLSSRTCPACLGMHGTEHPLSEPGPYGHQNCRCSRMPQVKPWSELGFEGIEEPPSLTPDADVFFARLNPAQQQAILGPQGYQAWRAGTYPRSAWASHKSTAGWRDSYVVAKPPSLPTKPTARKVAAKLPKGLPKSSFPTAQLLRFQADLKAADTSTAYALLTHRDAAAAHLARLEVLRRKATQPPSTLGTKLPQLASGADDIDDALLAINPNFSTGLDKWTNNCTNCTSAMELRRRGLDAVAKPLSRGRSLEDIAADWMVDPEAMEELGWVAAQSRILGYGDGARGGIIVRWLGGGAHIFNWEVDAGKVIWSDAQPGYSDATNFIDQYRARWINRIHVFRLDHLQLTDELGDYVTKGGTPP